LSNIRTGLKRTAVDVWRLVRVKKTPYCSKTDLRGTVQATRSLASYGIRFGVQGMFEMPDAFTPNQWMPVRWPTCGTVAVLGEVFCQDGLTQL
jgi:hypothetical protein